MCRLFGFRGLKQTSLSFYLVNATNSLEKQSVIDFRHVNNHCGWGLGFYQYNKAFI
jgi:predicted glutamine amidotransferase